VRNLTLPLAGTLATTMLLTNSPAPAAAPAATGQGGAILEEIVVTANRREESVQSVPAPLQVITGGELDEQGATGFEDYLNTISGVGLTKSPDGTAKVGIRGVSNVAGSNSGVASSKSAAGLYLNDIPIQGAGPLPDLTLYDLTRIEVLKGPQGTLYGEGAMGGAIKMIVSSADTAALAFKGDVGVSGTQHGGTNYQTRGMINLPLSTWAAVRITGTYQDNAGFIDNTLTGQDNINGSKTTSVRAVADTRFTDRLSSELILLHQRLNLSGFPQEGLDAGDLQINIPDHQYARQDFNLYALSLKYSFDSVDLLSATAYEQNRRSLYLRNPYVSRYDGLALEDFGLSGIAPTEPQGFTTAVNQSAVTEELRLSSRGETAIKWNLGAFFRHATQDATSNDTAGNYDQYNAEMQSKATSLQPLLSQLGATLGDALFSSATDFYLNRVNETYNQYALFGEADYQFASSWSLKVGLRGFHETQSVRQFNQALALEALDFELYGIPASAQSAQSISDHSLAPRVGLSYTLTPDKLLYTLVSKGFRSGGPNFNDGHASIPALYKPDSLYNYEVGTKTSWLDRRLIVNASAYYVDWRDVQVRAVDTATSTEYTSNAGNARVTGGELQILAAPGNPWQLGANLGLMNSKLISVGPNVSGAAAGTELPNAPKITASAFVQYSRPLQGLGTAILRFDYQHTGREAVALIAPTAKVPESVFFVPSYDTGRALIGFNGAHWNVTLYADNLWNTRGFTQRSNFLPNFAEQYFTVIEPRTIGLRLGVDY